MTTWKRQLSCEEINEMCQETMVSHLEIQVIDIGEDFIRASMPVNSNSCQPYGYLHGGASCALAETLGSIASFLAISDQTKIPMGRRLTSTHLKSVTVGSNVIGEVRPQSLNSDSHSWEISIFDEQKRLINKSTLECSLVEKR